MIESCGPPTNSTKTEDEFSNLSELICMLPFSVVPNHQNNWISHPWKPIKRGITWYFKLYGSQLRQIFIRECHNPRWTPKSKMAAENFGFFRLEFLVWLISTTMQKIRLVPKCVTGADLSCRTNETLTCGKPKCPSFHWGISEWLTRHCLNQLTLIAHFTEGHIWRVFICIFTWRKIQFLVIGL